MQVLLSSGETQDVFLFFFNVFFCVFKSSEYVVYEVRWSLLIWSAQAQRERVFKFYFFMCNSWQ